LSLPSLTTTLTIDDSTTSNQTVVAGRSLGNNATGSSHG
jgi:hypothetical protein